MIIGKQTPALQLSRLLRGLNVRPTHLTVKATAAALTHLAILEEPCT
jgi:hypothetical protein